MLVDWFTVLAQLLNFIILVWLMKRFLYQPILRAIDAREGRVAAQLTEASDKQSRAELALGELRRKSELFDRQRDELFHQAREEAERERRRLLEEARKDAEAFREKWQEQLGSDARQLSGALGRRIRTEAFATARQALADLATARLQDQVTALFSRRLREMPAPEKAQLKAAQKASSKPAVVRSAFDLTPEERASLGEAVQEALGAQAALTFESAPKLVLGIELVTGGLKVAWSLDDYLSSLEKAVDELSARRWSAASQRAPAAGSAQKDAADAHHP